MKVYGDGGMMTEGRVGRVGQIGQVPTFELRKVSGARVRLAGMMFSMCLRVKRKSSGARIFATVVPSISDSFDPQSSRLTNQIPGSKLLRTWTNCADHTNDSRAWQILEPCFEKRPDLEDNECAYGYESWRARISIKSHAGD